jgi:hypothetical protein
MELKLEEIYSNEITKLIEFAKNLKYKNCSDLSNILAYTSMMIKSKLLLFLSEFLIYLFENLEYVDTEKTDKRAIEMNKKVVKFLEDLKKLNIAKEDDKGKIINLMINIRYDVSEFQVSIGSTNRILIK